MQFASATGTGNQIDAIAPNYSAFNEGNIPNVHRFELKLAEVVNEELDVVINQIGDIQVMKFL